MEKTKLPEPFRTDWINALKSGEYNQGQCGRLHKDGCFCVLGVAGVLKGFTPIQLEEVSDYSELNTGLTRGERQEIFLWNDAGKTFPELADYIEQNH